MFDLITTPQLIEDRQVFLRTLAQPRLPSVERSAARQRAGHLLIRFGQWVEGRCPEIAIEPKVKGSYRTA